MSQERVLTLLYDKTFPPRANQQNPLLAQMTTAGRNMGATESAGILRGKESMNQFNYYGQHTAGEFVPEEDLALLEKEIEQVLLASTQDKRGQTQAQARYSNKQRGQTAGVMQGRRVRTGVNSVGISQVGYQMPLSANKFIRGAF